MPDYVQVIGHPPPFTEMPHCARVGGEPGAPGLPPARAGDGVPATGVTGLPVGRAVWNPWL